MLKRTTVYCYRYCMIKAVNGFVHNLGKAVDSFGHCNYFYSSFNYRLCLHNTQGYQILIFWKLPDRGILVSGYLHSGELINNVRPMFLSHHYGLSLLFIFKKPEYNISHYQNIVVYYNQRLLTKVCKNLP